MSGSNRLGDLQLAIMRVLWQRGEATALEVHAELLAERGLAPTTIATMLKKMEQKGVVAHRTEGRKHIFRPCVQERDVHRSMVSDLVQRLFGGDATALVNHLIEESELDEAELEEFKKKIAERRGQEGSNDDP